MRRSMVLLLSALVALCLRGGELSAHAQAPAASLPADHYAIYARGERVGLDAMADALAKAAGVTIRHRPFLLGPIFKAQGWDTSPFNIYEAKGRYMWRAWRWPNWASTTSRSADWPSGWRRSGCRGSPTR